MWPCVLLMWLCCVSFLCSALCLYSDVFTVLCCVNCSSLLCVFPLLCCVSACCSVSCLHVSQCHPPVGTLAIVWHRSRPIRHCNIISFVFPPYSSPSSSCYSAAWLRPLHCIVSERGAGNLWLKNLDSTLHISLLLHICTACFPELKTHLWLSKCPELDSFGLRARVLA